jgi:hypothetical protein
MNVHVRHGVFTENIKQLNNLITTYLFSTNCLCGIHSYVDVNMWNNMSERKCNRFKAKLYKLIMCNLITVNCPYNLTMCSMHPLEDDSTDFENILRAYGLDHNQSCECMARSPWASNTTCLIVNMSHDSKLCIVISDTCYQLIHIYQ